MSAQAFIRALLIAMIGAFSLGYALTAQGEETITFEWDYDAGAYQDLEEFRLFKRLNDEAYDYETPWAKIPAAAEAVEADGTRTYSKTLELVLPANVRGTYRFVMRAADAFNESGDSNEVEYPFSTAEVPRVLQFRINVTVAGPEQQQ